MDSSSTSDPRSGVAVFVAAAHARMFTSAAERLGLTKSAVGKTIARLEERLGFKAFHRTTRLTKPTTDGEAYFAAGTAAIESVTAAQAALSPDHRILSGRPYIDMPVAFGRRVLLPALIVITRPHPDLNPTLTFTDATSDLLQDDVDLPMCFGALSNCADLVARRFVTQDRVIGASPGTFRPTRQTGA